MTEMEKRGVPTVCFVAQGFARDGLRSAENFGLPDLPLAVVRETFTNQSPESVAAMVDEQIEKVVSSLTAALARQERESEITLIDEEWLVFEGEDLLAAEERMNDRFLEYGWSDGFRLSPATEAQIARMLTGTSRDPAQAVAILEPGFGIATVDKVATNAVMAGCRPEHLPVVIAAMECLADPKIDLRNKAMSTGPHAPLLLVNGPIRKKIGLNSGVCTLGPGTRSFANSVIGRAVRLCMMNLGHVYPGISDMDTVGSPARYSLCAAENEEASPWSAYHVEHGFSADTSTATVHFAYGICELYDFQNYEPGPLSEVFATAMWNVAQVPAGYWLLGRRADPRYGTEEKEHYFLFICPDHAQIFRRGGWSKQDIRRAIHRKARLPFRTLMLNKEPKAVAASHPELNWLWDSPETMVPILEDEDCYNIAVVGGAAGRGALFYGAGEPVTRVIEE